MYPQRTFGETKKTKQKLHVFYNIKLENNLNRNDKNIHNHNLIVCFDKALELGGTLLKINQTKMFLKSELLYLKKKPFPGHLKQMLSIHIKNQIINE